MLKEPHVTLLQAVRSVAGVAVSSNMSTTRARSKHTQTQEQLFTTGRFFLVALALDTKPLHSMLSLEVTLLQYLQKCAMTPESEFDSWP